MNPFNWMTDENSAIPKHRQIYDFFMGKISSGEWHIGRKMPTQMELAKAFGVNRSTIVEAFDALKAEGLIESRSSAGTVIVNNTWSILTSSAPPDWERYVSTGTHKPNLNIIKIINELEEDTGVIRLGAGELARDMYPGDFMQEVYGKLLRDMKYMGYEEPKGVLALREEVCRYLGTQGIITQPSKVLIVSGALQALHLVSIGILHRGSTVLVEKPSYLKSLSLFESAGINLKGLEMDKSGVLPAQIVRNCTTKKPELLYTIPCFHNPTGVLMQEKRRIEILETCERERLAIIEDDTYRELWLDEKPPLPMKAFDRNGAVLYMGSISKTLSAGLRLGWIVGSETVIDRLSDIKMQTDYGTSSISQWIGYEFLSHGYYQQFVGDIRNQLRVRRDLALQVLDAHFRDIATWERPLGGFYIWLTLNKPVPMYKLFETCYKNGLIINPGNVYDYSNDRNIRISYSYAALGDLEKGLAAFAGILKNEFQ